MVQTGGATTLPNADANNIIIHHVLSHSVDLPQLVSGETPLCASAGVPGAPLVFEDASGKQPPRAMDCAEADSTNYLCNALSIRWPAVVRAYHLMVRVSPLLLQLPVGCCAGASAFGMNSCQPLRMCVSPISLICCAAHCLTSAPEGFLVLRSVVAALATPHDMLEQGFGIPACVLAGPGGEGHLVLTGRNMGKVN